VGQGKDDMIVGTGSSSAERLANRPGVRRLAFWAMPIQARVVRDGALSAAITLLDVSPERGCTANGNGAQNLKVQSGQPAAMRFTNAVP